MRKWISLESGCEISGHPSVRSLASWVIRWNLKNPQALVLRRHGKVDAVSLEVAIEEEAKIRTPGYNVAAAVIDLKDRNTRRK